VSRWFRLYAQAMRSPKVARLSDKDFRLWVEMLSVASENDGQVPPLDDLRHLLNRRLDHLSSAVERLISGGLMDRLASGYEPHNWSKFQYKSDTSTERTRKHRKARNVPVTPPDTEADTETDTLPKGSDGEPSSGKALWDEALAYYGKNRRALIGKWVKVNTAEVFIDVLADCQRNDPLDRISWTEAALKKRKGSSYELELPIC